MLVLGVGVVGRVGWEKIRVDSLGIGIGLY